MSLPFRQKYSIIDFDLFLNTSWYHKLLQAYKCVIIEIRAFLLPVIEVIILRYFIKLEINGRLDGNHKIKLLEGVLIAQLAVKWFLILGI